MWSASNGSNVGSVGANTSSSSSSTRDAIADATTNLCPPPPRLALRLFPSPTGGGPEGRGATDLRGVIMMDVIFGCLVVDIASLQYFPYGASTVSVGRHLFLLGGGTRLWSRSSDLTIPFPLVTAYVSPPYQKDVLLLGSQWRQLGDGRGRLRTGIPLNPRPSLPSYQGEPSLLLTSGY